MRPLLTRTARVLVGGAFALALAACSDDDGGSAGDDTEVTSVDDTETPSDETDVDTTATEESIPLDSGTDGDTSASSGTVAEGDEATCEALRPISEHDAATGPLIEAGDWEEIQSFLIESEAAVVGGYEEAAELEPELADDVLALRDLTVEYTAAAADAPDLETWIGELTAMISEHPEAGPAGLDLDTWALEHCGFSTGGN